MNEEEHIDYLKKLGVILLELRTEKKLSQQELSYRTGIEKPYIRQLEKGRIIKTLLKLSEALEIPLHKILERIN